MARKTIQHSPADTLFGMGIVDRPPDRFHSWRIIKRGDAVTNTLEFTRP
jgi:hypothetical protein